MGILRTKASDDELAYLRQTLEWIFAHKPEALAALFSPTGPRPTVTEPPSPIVEPLLAFGLVDRVAPGKIVGRRRLRRIGSRFYVLDIGLGDEVEYRQDVWPETDALLAALDEHGSGRLLDLGTGCGMVAVEGAARGYDVVATDLFPSAIALARFNARLNGVENIDFRTGWMWSAVEGETFDLVLTNPHYGSVEDQLRLEVLRGAAAHLSPCGRLRLATVLEWENGVFGLEAAFADLEAQGVPVAVTPLVSDLKRDWFYETPDLVSRHRFVIDCGRHHGRTFPVAGGPIRNFVPLSRLRSPDHALLSTAADVETLSRLLSSLVAGHLQWEHPPRGLLDACRVGAQICVGPRGAAGAIVRNGEIRPCTVGGVIGGLDDGVDSLRANLDALAAEAALRRGCATCPAAPHCSRCLFPLPLDEADYCNFMRAHVDGLPLLRRLWSVLADLDERAVAWGPLTITIDGNGWLIRLGSTRWHSPSDGEIRLVKEPT